MCGIAGWVSTRQVDSSIVDAQLQTVLHRGPDSLGVFAAGRGAVGQTRLSIIDLVTGDPPITDESGTIGAVLNGEIYNFAALRAGLAVEGHAFSTSGDTEVLAHLAEHLSAVDLARQLDGMFAFAVWDSTREKLVLGRDRVGKKPLYYWWDGRDLVFGSEIKTLLRHPAVPRRLDASAIPDFLVFGYVPTPRTFFDGIRSLPPGCVLTLEPGRDPVIEEYWHPPVAGVGGVSALRVTFDEAEHEVRRLLGAAVRRRLVSDVPLGAFLSGGVDSSAVVALMAQESSVPVETFCMGFEDSEFDERPFARLVAARLGTRHHEFVVRPQPVELVERLVWHHDQPFGDSSAIPMMLLAEQTRRHVTVALSGDGGDELFAGYERFAAATVVGGWSRLPPRVTGLLAHGAGAVARVRSARLAHRVERFAAAADRGLPEAYLSWVGVASPDLAEQLARGVPSQGRREYAALWAESVGAHTLDRLLLLNLRTYLLDDLLPKVDRTSMAHGLEVRVPFLDRDLLEYAFRLPPSYKHRGLRLKRVLKAAVRDLLPAEVLNRPKRGFGVPLDRWFRGELAEFTEDLLGPQARLREHVDGATVDTVLVEHARGHQEHGHLLWSLVTLEVFLRREGW
jgi:asparagine synthase (glutamine-hydrolysing)